MRPPGTSEWFRQPDFWRYRPAIAGWGACCAAMAMMFAAQTVSLGSPMTPGLYGAHVYAIPALIWCAYQWFFAVLAAVGAAARRPLMAMAGLLALGVEFFALGVLAALDTRGGNVIVCAALTVFFPICGVSASAAWRSRGGRT